MLRIGSGGLGNLQATSTGWPGFSTSCHAASSRVCHVRFPRSLPLFPLKLSFLSVFLSLFLFFETTKDLNDSMRVFEVERLAYQILEEACRRGKQRRLQLESVSSQCRFLLVADNRLLFCPSRSIVLF
jgi:hypothetical protein